MKRGRKGGGLKLLFSIPREKSFQRLGVEVRMCWLAQRSLVFSGKKRVYYYMGCNL